MTRHFSKGTRPFSHQRANPPLLHAKPVRLYAKVLYLRAKAVDLHPKLPRQRAHPPPFGNKENSPPNELDSPAIPRQPPPQLDTVSDYVLAGEFVRLRIEASHHIMKKKTLPDFTNKIVQASLFGDDHSYAMDSPHFEMQGERLFLVGVVPHGGTSSNWSEGAICAVAWDRVTDYLVFDSLKHYQKGREISKKYVARKT